VIHGVAGYAIMRIAVDRGVGLAASIAIGTAFAFTAAALLHYFVEGPTQAWGKQFASGLHRSGRGAFLQHEAGR